MKGISHFNETWKALVSEMCRSVGANPDNIDFKNDANWFTQYSWTISQEREYKEWFINYFLENKKRLVDISQATKADKRKLAKIADAFVFQYGWRVKE